jgi:hypothetical protein
MTDINVKNNLEFAPLHEMAVRGLVDVGEQLMVNQKIDINMEN